MPFNAPAPVPGLPVPPAICNEKSAGNVTYPQPCATNFNSVWGFGPNSKSPNTAFDHFTWKICNDRHPAHRSGFNVCRYCVAAAEDERWFKLATTYFTKKPPAAAEDNRSRYYLTRLCRLCEHREETLLAQLDGTAPNSIPPQSLPTLAARRSMADWPSNRCVCERNTLYSGVKCLPHRREFWDRQRPNYARDKARNKQYLIHTVRDGNQRVDATVDEMDQRRANGLWRACRCGEDPVATTAEAVVMQCMSCEGIVHFRGVPGGPQPAFGTPPTPAPTPLEVSQNSLTTPRLFRIHGGWGDNR